MKDDVLDGLFTARRELGRLLIETTPASAEDRSRLEKLLAKRDQLNATIRAVVDARFRAAQSPELDRAIESLHASTHELTTLASTIASVDKAVDLAGRTMDLASKVLGLAAM